MKVYTPMEYFQADCPFAKQSADAFLAVYILSQGKVCDTGCGWFDSGKCPGYRKLTVPAKVAAGQEPSETVRETAARLGITLAEVRRRRRQSA